MDVISFKKSLKENTPPQNISVYLQALWYERKGNWEKAHQLIQDMSDPNAAWIHAFLHRKEGDVSNADYWYHRAGRKRPTISLEKEWDEIVVAMI